MAQFRFHTRKILWLGSYAVPLSYNKFSTTWSFALPLPYKSFDFKSRSSASIQKKVYLWLEVPQFCFRTRNTLCFEVQQFCFRTQNNLWFEVPQFRTIYCDLNFRSSVSARKDVIWNSALLLLHENITFFVKSTLIQPPTHFLIFVLSYMNDGPSEGQRNKGIGMLLAKVVVNVWLRAV